MHATIIMSISTTLVDDVVIDSKVSATPQHPYCSMCLTVTATRRVLAGLQ